MVVGIDEVGRGAWAGPLAVGAVALGGEVISGLTDSKLLSKKRREELYREIKLRAAAIGIGWVSSRDIDNIGLGPALKLAAHRAVSQIAIDPQTQIIIDGTVNLLDDARVTTMKKADILVPSCSAASIIAKVARDRYMAATDILFDGYEFSRHVGYGSSKHKQAIENYGLTPLHRLSFAPIRQFSELHQSTVISGQTAGISLPADAPVSTGRQAESVAAAYLRSNGYMIVDKNWRTKWCEIDIIAMKGGVITFVEVKYRRTSNQGGGVAAITTSKLRQMQFAARLWLQNQSDEYNARLGFIEVSGANFAVSEFVASIE